MLVVQHDAIVLAAQMEKAGTLNDK